MTRYFQTEVPAIITTAGADVSVNWQSPDRFFAISQIVPTIYGTLGLWTPEYLTRDRITLRIEDAAQNKYTGTAIDIMTLLYAQFNPKFPTLVFGPKTQLTFTFQKSNILNLNAGTINVYLGLMGWLSDTDPTRLP